MKGSNTIYANQATLIAVDNAPCCVSSGFAVII